MFAELYGKQTGVCKGKAGSMHLCAPQVGMFGSSAVVGTIIPHALGVAYASKLKRDGSVTTSVSGDGSTEEGVFHECMNLASLKDLPVLFLIENNGLAIHALLKERQSYSLKDLTHAFRISYTEIENGYDIEGVLETTSGILEKIRKTSRPAVLEIQTYRSFEHVGVRTDFHTGYRNSDEYAPWKERDPLFLKEEWVEKFKGPIQAEIYEAVQFAEQSPFPTQAELLKDVY